MRAVAYQKSLPITEANSLVDIELPKPEPKGRELLVEVKAISVNPVDTKVRMRAEPPAGEWRVLGWDAAGVVGRPGRTRRCSSPATSLLRGRDRSPRHQCRIPSGR